MNTHRLIFTTTLLALFTTATTAVLAATANASSPTWKQTHPRRTEVNQHLNNQNARVNSKVISGQMTQAQSHQIKKEDHRIRQEERDMASQNGGHITKQEQKTLNQQESKVSKQIKNE